MKMKKIILSISLSMFVIIAGIALNTNEIPSVIKHKEQKLLLKKILALKPSNANLYKVNAEEPTGKIEQLPDSNDNSVFLNDKRELYTLGTIGNDMSYVSVNQTFNRTTQRWVNSQKMEATIDVTQLDFDSIYIYNWNDATSGWDLFLKSVVYRNSSEKPEYQLATLYFSGMEIPFGRTDFYYDSNMLKIAEVAQEFSFSTFQLVYSDSTHYTNDANGNVTREYIANWDTDLEEWVNADQYFNTYDANNNTTQTIYESWGTINSVDQWISNNRYDMTYNSNNKTTSEYTYYWNSNSSNWEYSTYKEYFYTSFNEYDYIQHYLFVTGNFAESRKEIYTYLSDESQEYVIYKKIENGNYVNEGRDVYMYGTHPTAPNAPTYLTATPLKMMSSSVKLEWFDNSNNENGFSIWRSTDGTNYTVIENVDADVEEFTDTDLDEGTLYYYTVTAFNFEGDSDFSNSEQVTTTVTSVAKVINNNDKLVVYPNPANTNFSFNKSGIVTIYDFTGKLVKTITVPANESISTDGLAKGIYNVRLENTDKINSIKLTIE